MTSGSSLRGIVDSSAFSGRPTGPMVVADQLMARWPERHVDDQITTWRPASSDVGTLARTTEHLARPRRAFRADGPLDFYLSINPTVPLRVPPGIVVGVVVCDYRHVVEPERFSVGQRLYRSAAWGAGIRRADVVFAISNDTRKSVRRSLGRDAVVIPLGSDHAVPASTTAPTSASGGAPRGPVVALCHRANKPAKVAIDAWRQARRMDPTVPDLVVLGVPDSVRDRLTTTVPEVDTGEITLRGPLPQAEFETTFATATAILFLSSHEGYGLPMAEGLHLGIPVVAFELPPLREIAGPDYPMARPGDTTAAAELLVEACGDEPPTSHARLSSWNDAVDVVRATLADICAANATISFDRGTAAVSSEPSDDRRVAS